MLDIDRRPAAAGTITPSPHYAAGLRRLSTRAAGAGAGAAPSPRLGLLSFSPFAETLVAHLRSSGVPLLPGLSPEELARAEAVLSVAFPPDLRALLTAAIPAAPGFPDWRQPNRLIATLKIPFAVVRRRSAGAGGSALRRAPILLPVFDRCYIPVRPLLAGNPIFVVEESRIACAAVDLADFFRRRENVFASSPTTLSSPAPVTGAALRRQYSAVEKPSPPAIAETRRSLDSIAGKAPRWIEFWSDAATADRRRKSSSAVAGADEYVELRLPKFPEWVRVFLESMGTVLRDGGWKENEVAEMVDATTTTTGGRGVDAQALMDSLLLKADRCSDSLRRAGWSSDEVSDVLGFEIRWEKQHRPPLSVPPAIVRKLGSLVETVAK